MGNYLYGGINLPKLPEWDKETYPYAVLRSTGKETTPYAVYYSKQIPTLNDSGKVFVCSFAYHGMVTYCDYTEGALAWRDTSETLITSTSVDGVFWTNTDILDSAGEVYLSASDPIPVNPAPALDPTSLLMGWQVGNRIRQRGGA